MPTATATPVEISAELWRHYRRQRADHPRPGVAASRALDEVHILKGPTRERLTRALTEREQANGLAPSRAEAEADAAAEAGAVEDVPAEPEPGSADAIEADARHRLETLREQRQRLAPEALTDADAKAEMLSLEDEMRAAERALDLVDVARGETGRREREQAEQAERERRENATESARKAEPGIAKRKAGIDRLLAAAAIETAALQAEQQQHVAFLAESGLDPFNLRAHAFRPDDVERAIAHAFRGTGVMRGPGRVGPLAPEREGQ